MFNIKSFPDCGGRLGAGKSWHVSLEVVTNLLVAAVENLDSASSLLQMVIFLRPALLQGSVWSRVVPAQRRSAAIFSWQLVTSQRSWKVLFPDGKHELIVMREMPIIAADGPDGDLSAVMTCAGLFLIMLNLWTITTLKRMTQSLQLTPPN